MRKTMIATAAAALLSVFNCTAQKTSFAIFADQKTYEHCSAELAAYKAVLDKEGLKTEIFHADWKSPEEVKALILKKAADRKRPLEGVVFVGEVPIVMVREGQHMTSAFKMDEDNPRFPIQESSVASDRYYDDFDLDFEFIQRDTEDTTRFFYRLTEKGAQTLRPEIYSARIKVPKFMIDEGKDRYELISKFLKKAVAAHNETNVLDNMTFFYGSGYYSEDMTVYRQKNFEWKEVFPHTTATAAQHRFLHFHQEEQMKWTLFSELQRPETDYFQFSEHGAPETQYISGDGPERPDLNFNMNALKGAVARKGRYGRQVLDGLAEHFTEKAFTDSAKRAYFVADSLQSRHKDLYQEEIAGLHSNPRIVVLNACYNGSFHNPEGYVAGAHLFTDGRCVVAQGNTVNALQDKFEEKLVGLLSMGIRAGFWQKEASYLECHMCGDPTFRFTATKEDQKLSKELYKGLVEKPLDVKYWTKMVSHEAPIARATAITHLGYAGNTDKALLMLRKDPSSMVRLHALNALVTTDNDRIEDALLAGFDDPYELIVRFSLKAAEKYAAPGRDSLILKGARHIREYHPELVRCSYYIGSIERINERGGMFEDMVAEVNDQSLSTKERYSSVRAFRNGNYIPAIESFLTIAGDNNEETKLRRDCLEALGWYTLSADKDYIISSLKSMLAQHGSTYPDRVRNEMVKTIKRLEFR